MSDDNRLFQLYQIFMSLADGDYSGECDGVRYGEEYEEFYMPAGESGVSPELDEAKMIRLADAIVEIATATDDEFEDDRPTRREVFEALKVGPELYNAFADHLSTAIDTVVGDWKLKFPECETLGEVKKAQELAGPRLQ